MNSPQSSIPCGHTCLPARTSHSARRPAFSFIPRGAVTLFACAFLQTHPSARAFSPASGVSYRIESQSSGLLFWENIYDSSQHVPLVLQTLRGGGDATWTFASMGGGYYQILNPLRNLVLACDSGNASVYLEPAASSAGYLWSLNDEGNGYVSLVNKLNGNVLTIQNPPGASYGAVVTAANTHASSQRFWIDQFRINPIQTISVPAGWDTTAAKRIVLCSSTNQGSSIAGSLSGPPGTRSVQFSSAGNVWGQYYYLYTDTSFAHTPGSYTVAATGFPSASFVVDDYVYRSTPNNIGGNVGITDILSGFFAWQREPGTQTGMEERLYASDGSYTVIGHSGDLHGGWKDATSTDIEIVNNAEGLRNLSYAAEDALNPSDRSALLAEVAFGASFFVRLQNSNGSFPVCVIPDSNYLKTNVDCGITARAVIGLAAAARVLNGYNNTLATQCLNAAASGWTWVKNNQSNYITSNNIYQSYWWGNAQYVMGAAAEMAVTTPGSTTYQNDAASFFNAGKFDANNNWVKQSGSYVHQSGGGDAALGLARYYRTLAAGTLRTNIGTQLTNYYNVIAAANNTAFGTNSGNFNSSFGGNTGYSNNAVNCLNLYRALGDSRMLASAHDFMNWMYGANPFGSAFIIGTGSVNAVPQYSRPRPSSIGEIVPGVVPTSSGSITTWGGSDYGVGEGGVGATSMLPEFMALLDRQINFNKFEAESLTVVAYSPVVPRTFTDPAFSGGAGSILDGTGVGNYVTYLLPAIAQGAYDVRIGVKNLNTRGIWQLAVGRADDFNGSENNVGTPQDSYSAGTTFTEFDLGTWTPYSTGDKWFRFMITGKNASSSGYSESFDYIKLIPQ